MPTTTIPSGQDPLEWRLSCLLAETQAVHGELNRLHADMRTGSAQDLCATIGHIRDEVGYLVARVECVQQAVPVAGTLARVYQPDYGSGR